MQIEIPHSWLTEYCATKKTPQEIGRRVAISGPSIERVVQKDGEWLYDTEVTTNRIDAFSVIGFAREVSAILGLKWHEVLDGARLQKSLQAIAKKAVSNRKKSTHSGYALSVKIEDKRCRRYCGIMLDGVKVKPSPVWLRKRLELCGVRSINNVVDITNYVMLEYGQPMHAFDADLLDASVTKKTNTRYSKEIVVRPGKKGEKITTLDHEEKNVEGIMVIADAESALAIAGVKGGQKSGITNDTTTILLESASFDPLAVRTASRMVNIRTDAVTRFEKNLSQEYAPFAIIRAVELLEELADARVVTPVVDVYPQKQKIKSYTFDWSTLERMAGIKIANAAVINSLHSLGFATKQRSGGLTVTPPFWRQHEIEGEADFVEEVVRLHGYDQLPMHSLSGEIPMRTQDPSLHWESVTKRYLKDVGLTEVYTYSLIDEVQMSRCGIDADKALEVYNPLSSDFRYMRPSLLPGLLAVIADHEQKRDEVMIFELSKIYEPKKNDLPLEVVRLAFAYGSKLDTEHALFLKLKGAVEAWLSEVMSGERVNCTFDKMQDGQSFWDVEKSAVIHYRGKTVGIIGVPSAVVKNAWGLHNKVVCADVDFAVLVSAMNSTAQYVPPAKFPAVLRDVAFVIDKGHTYSTVVAALRAVSPLVATVELFDVFEGKSLGAGRHSLAFHIVYASADRTLTAEEADSVHGQIRMLLEKDFGVQLR